MAEPQNPNLFRNLCLLHLQKLTLELKCPLCFNLLRSPLVFPCNHIFCDGCIVMSEESKQKCPTCQLQCLDQEIRPAPYMESIVRLCESLEESVNAKAYRPSSEDNLTKQTPTTVNMNCNSQKKLPSEIPQKRVYAIQRDESVNSIQGETESEKPRLACEEVEQSSEYVIISDDDDDNIVEDCKAAKNCETIVNMEEPLNEDKGRIDGENMDAVHPETPFIWSDIKKRKRSEFGATRKVRHNTKPTEHCLVRHSSPSSKTADANKFVCAFCHSSEKTEGTGRLLGFLDKKEIDLTSLPIAARSNVLIAHEKCIHWSPQVFYVGEHIQNLESEVARAAKLKCRTCGKKGASLGCFLDSCPKTYHVPCAYFNCEIRWDCKNYLMLCPSHSSCKFPGEIFESEKCIDGERLPSPPKILEQSSFWANTPGGKKELVLCGSDLSAEHETQLDNFATTYGVNVSKSWNQNVTHVVTSTDASGACTRTFEFLMAILNGKWIVKFDWLKDCVKANHLLDERDYEIKTDKDGFRDGPGRGRLHLSENSPKLFAGKKFYLFGDFEPDELKELLELVEAAGGDVVKSKENMMASRASSPPSSCFVVYNCNPPRGNPEGDSSFRFARIKEAVDVAVPIGAGIMRHTWILECIAGYKLLPLI